MQNKKRVIVPLVAIAVAAALVATYVQGRARHDPNVVRVSGNVEVVDAEVSFKIPGRVEARLVSEGEAVRAGQAVARLDTTELAQEAALRRAEVRAAQADLAELEAGSRPEEIAQAEAALRQVEVEAGRWQVEHARQKDLYKQDVVSAQEYEVAAAAHEASQAKVREARERLALFKKGPRQERIEQARARLERARQALAAAETRLGYATLASPLSGVVLSDHVEPGEYVAAGTPVVTVGDVEKVYLRAYIDETDLGRVKAGQRVRVTADTYPGRVYGGQVSFIASGAEFTPKNVQTQKERVKLVYRIKVAIPNPALELKPGMPADAEVLTGGGGG